MNQSTKFIKNFLPAVLWALLILILCGIPGKDIPHVSFLELLNFDKFVHAFIFFVLILLFMRGIHLQSLNKKFAIYALSFCIAYGGLLEIMQGAIFIERTADVYDFAANSFGSIMGFLLSDYLLRVTF